MEVNGKEFLRNVGIEEDKQSLEKEQKKLDEQKRNSIKKDDGYFQEDPTDEGVSVNISSDSTLKQDDFNNLYDIKLNPDANSSNKKKYLILIASLILLFIITIVIIRVISNSDEQNKLQEQQPTQSLEKDNQLNSIKTDEQYQEIIKKDEKLDFTQPDPINQVQEKKELILPEPVKEAPPVNIESVKNTQTKKDIFGIEKKESVQKTPSQTTAVQEKEKLKQKLKDSLKQKVQTKKQVVLPPPEVKNFVKPANASNPKGYFIQIGSFTKKPASSYLKNITSKGYSYTLHKVTIKGKEYNKLLIGAYPSHGTAKKNLSKIKKDLKAPGAYILKL